MKTPELAPPTHWLERLPQEWGEVLAGWGEPAYRGKQVFGWIHKRGVLDPEQMTNLPKSLRAKLAEDGVGPLPLEVVRARDASDETRKLLVRMHDGLDVETVLIPQLVKDPDVDEADRSEDLKAGLVPGSVVTQCISSQVGCAMGCVFCASGVAGLQRHLSAAEIVAQVIEGRDRLHEHERLRNVVLMGMGEPLHNYDNVARALVLLTHPDGIGLSTRRVTLSTSGLVPAIDRLAEDFEGKVALAISLHAVDDEARSKIMPVNRKYPLQELVACLKRYPMPKRRRITIEYTLIRGVNDDLRDADRMVKLLRGVPVKVNLIPMNPIVESALEAPAWDGVHAFCDRLRDRGVTATIRRQRGNDVDAACGQLALYGPDGERTEGRRKRLKVVAK
ncbi:MAG: 23S rRNA (adenine(2503)-C(2))-methyltransferase RlmN [Sandaracinus sp.]|nr:23S rRNA (adenine(2503)-C(2))-methyltransferase RlmN [Sandaracinus sp.]|tara:strand:+ start:225 stop:1397 length:1173 start_codon:yes stop_codon:yes gene_type:complete